MKNLVDIHTHLTDPKFSTDIDQVVERAVSSGLRSIVVNGLDPKTNREVLAMAEKYEVVKPALGIYPVDAINELYIPEGYERIDTFSVKEEIAFINENADKLTAIGECGLDGYWVDDAYFKPQEEVFLALCEVAMNHDLPVICHSRKRERRTIEILTHHGVKKVDYHCFSGRTKWALEAAEKYGWHFSIPCNAHRNEAFQKLLKNLPKECILTETDAPYLGYERGVRNEPANVKYTVKLMAEIRGISDDEAADQVWANYLRLVSKKK